MPTKPPKPTVSEALTERAARSIGMHFLVPHLLIVKIIVVLLGLWFLFAGYFVGDAGDSGTNARGWEFEAGWVVILGLSTVRVGHVRRGRARARDRYRVEMSRHLSARTQYEAHAPALGLIPPPPRGLIAELKSFKWNDPRWAHMRDWDRDHPAPRLALPTFWGGVKYVDKL